LSTTFQHTFVRVGVAHGAVLLLLVALPFLLRFFRPRLQTSTMTTFVTLEAAPARPTPVPVAEPTPAPEPAPEPAPTPVPPKPTKKPIVVSKERVKNPKQAPAPKPRPVPNVEKELGSVASSVGPVLQDALPAWYYNKVRQVMHDAWQQPGELSGLTGLICTVSIRVERDGRITACRMLRGSGNKTMDDSVMVAARSVTVLSALPSVFPGKRKDITVEFELTL